MGAQIKQFLIGADNFGVLVHDRVTGATASIDAGEAGPIADALDEAGWTLTHILVTHRHGDHVAGIPALKARTGAKAVGPAAEAKDIPGLDEAVGEGDRVSVGALAAIVLETPGHTKGHIAFHFPQERLVFTGDTLFALGCGRIFEGTPAIMWASLLKLAALPDETRVYCGHEYTLSNGRFALTVDPVNAALVQRMAEIEATRAAGGFALPTTIGLEKATNPFLRTSEPAIAARLGLSGRPPVAVFAELRERKNRG